MRQFAALAALAAQCNFLCPVSITCLSIPVICTCVINVKPRHSLVRISICMYIYKNTYTYTCTYTHIYIYISIYLSIYLSVYIYIYMYVYIYIYMCVIRVTACGSACFRVFREMGPFRLQKLGSSPPATGASTNKNTFGV